MRRPKCQLNNLRLEFNRAGRMIWVILIQDDLIGRASQRAFKLPN